MPMPLAASPPRVSDHVPSSMTPAPEPFLDQAQDPLVRDPVLEELHQPAVVEAGEEVADVRVEHPVHLPALDPDRERIQRIMRAAPRPKPVREAEEVRLVDGVQHLDDRPLEDLVLQRGDPERPQPPVRPSGCTPSATASPGSAPRGPERADPGGSPPDPARSPRHVTPSTPGAAFGLIARYAARRRSTSTWCRSAVNRASLSCRATLAHTIQLTWRAQSGSASGARFAGRVPLGQPPSLHHLRRRRRGVVRRLRRYYGTV